MSYHTPGKGYTVYTKSNCPSCEIVKMLLPDAMYVNCDVYLEDVDAFLDFLDLITDKQPSKFPMVFLDGNYIDTGKVFTMNEEF